jgi:FkbM family methyltransferase
MNAGLAPVDCTLCENRFGRYCVPRSSQHRPAPQTLLSGGVWELETLEFMRAHTSDRSIVHAGTFFGDFLPALSRALDLGRTLYCFEPNPENYAAARWTEALNGLHNVRLRQAALGERMGRALLQTADSSGLTLGGGSKIVAAPALKPGGAVTAEVDVLAIDDAIADADEVGIIQLDVEGHEASALLGALKTIRRCRPIIILETVPTQVIAQKILPLGYRQTDTICGNAVFAVG